MRNRCDFFYSCAKNCAKANSFRTLFGDGDETKTSHKHIGVNFSRHTYVDNFMGNNKCAFIINLEKEIKFLFKRGYFK